MFGENDERPRYWTVLWPLLFFVATLYGVQALVKRYPFAAVGGGIVAVALALIVIENFIWYIDRLRADRIEALNRANAQTPWSILAEQMKYLSPEAVKTINFYGRTVWELEPGEKGTEFYLRGTQICSEFADYFLSRCTNTHLLAVGHFGDNMFKYDGTRMIEDRKQASDFTSYCVARGWARWGAGNIPAYWIGGFNPNVARKLLGLEQVAEKQQVVDENEAKVV